MCKIVVQIYCICHTASLVANHALKHIPGDVERFVSAAMSYVTGSSKRMAELDQFMECFGDERQRLLKLSKTRWLACQPCVSRLLGAYNSLTRFFQLEVVQEPKNGTAAFALAKLGDPWIKGYSFFLEHVLEIFNKFNALFQERDVLIHNLAGQCRELLEDLCGAFIKSPLLNHVEKINVSNPHNQVSISFLPFLLVNNVSVHEWTGRGELRLAGRARLRDVMSILLLSYLIILRADYSPDSEEL